MKFQCRYLNLGLFFTLIFTSNVTVASPQSKQHHAPHWSYGGATGSSHWAELNHGFALCGSGKRQSPVDVYSQELENLYSLQFNYDNIPLQLINNGHTLQANYKDVGKQNTVMIGGKSYPLVAKAEYNSELMLGDVPYKLLQFHYHTPSEHAFNGKRYAMEVHLVHKNTNGNLAVVGVFIKAGNHNELLQQVLDNISSTVNQTSIIKDVLINAATLLPENRGFFYYNGSLTTPPCSENVNWFVMRNPIEASSEQVNRFAQLIGKNARPLQPLNWRNPLGSL